MAEFAFRNYEPSIRMDSLKKIQESLKMRNISYSWFYLWDTHNGEYFYFKNKNDAFLFKLVWGSI